MILWKNQKRWIRRANKKCDRKDNVKFLAINGVKPTDETIANISYPLTKVVYAVYRKDEAQNSNVRKLVNWLKTEEGKKAVSAGGYVPLAK